MTVVSLQAEMVDTSVCYEKSNVRTFTMGECFTVVEVVELLDWRASVGCKRYQWDLM